MSGTKRLGSALPLCIGVVAAVGAAATTLFGRGFVEHDRVRHAADVECAEWRATGELELAKSVILAAPFVDGRNAAIAAALAAEPPRIAGTSAVIEAAGPSRWFRLTARATIASAEGVACCLVSDGTAVSEIAARDDALDDALDGARHGASPSAAVDFTALESAASYVAPAGRVVDIELEGRVATLHLDLSEATVAVPTTTTKEVVVGYETRPVETPVEVLEWQWVPETATRKAFVKSGVGTSTGRWKTVSTTTQVYRQVARVDHVEMRPTQVALTTMVTTPATVTQSLAGALRSTVTVPADGVLYVPGAIRSLKGELNGRLTIVSGASVTLTGSLRFVDDAGRGAFDPRFARGHALAVIARGDVVVSATAPTDLELDATLISAAGRVAVEDGSPDRASRSIHRLGVTHSFLGPVALSSARDVAGRFDAPPACPILERVTFLDSTRGEPVGAPLPVARPSRAKHVAPALIASEHLGVEQTEAQALAGRALESFVWKEFDRAADFARESRELDPACPLARKLLAWCAVATEDDGEAVELLTDALNSDPGDVDLQYLLAKSHVRNREWGAAKDLLADLFKRRAPEPSWLLEFAHACVGEQDLAGACAALSVARELDPTNRDVLDLRIDVDLQRGRFESASEELRARIDLAPEEAAPRYRLAHVLLAEGQVEEATRVLAAAAREFPEDPMARTMLDDARRQEIGRNGLKERNVRRR